MAYGRVGQYLELLLQCFFTRASALVKSYLVRVEVFMQLFEQFLVEESSNTNDSLRCLEIQIFSVQAVWFGPHSFNLSADVFV